MSFTGSFVRKFVVKWLFEILPH